jgi:glucose/mannose-6-phosphate isomerase
MKKIQNKIDKENLRQVIIDFPQQFAEGLKLAENIKIKGAFSSVIVSGMGGSALPTEVVKLYLDETNSCKKYFSLLANRTYSIPVNSYKNCLHIVSSFSGNTEETLSALNEIIKRKLPAIGIAHEGKLINLCKKNNIPCIELPFVLQPRYATGLFFSAMLKILANSGFIKLNEKDILEKTKQLKKVAAKLESKGRFIAEKIVGKTPVIYSSDKLRAISMIWKIKINENAKTPAFYNVYPELSHNEMVGFTLPQGKFHILTLMDKNDHPQIIKRMKITAKLYERKGINTTLIEISNANTFSLIFQSLILGDWISYYLALAYKQDPTPVKMVEDLKKMLI